jgi:Protein of unknown function (DUF3047)
VTVVLALAQTLTNLMIVPAGPGVPAGWTLNRMQGVDAPAFEVTRSHTLRVTAVGQGGTATYRLRPAIRPVPTQRQGTITWRWRAVTPLRAADLKRRAEDDSPMRVVITFQDGRSIVYAWGNREGRGESFVSWTGRNRMVVVLQRAEDADGSWHEERRDPFSDYRRLWNIAPKPIVSVGVSTDSDALKVRAAAEIGDLTWHAP